MIESLLNNPSDPCHQLSRESLDKRGLSGGIEQKREPLAVNYL